MTLECCSSTTSFRGGAAINSSSHYVQLLSTNRSQLLVNPGPAGSAEHDTPGRPAGGIVAPRRAAAHLLLLPAGSVRQPPKRNTDQNFLVVFN